MDDNSQEGESSDLDSSRMPLWQHLDELRKSLVRSLLVLSVVTFFTYQYADKILEILEKPILDALPPESRKLYFTGVTDKFMVYLKAAIYSAVFVSAPFLLFELYRFVSPGLYKKERRMVIPFIFFGTFFFILGGVFAYYMVLPYGYQFLVNFGSSAEVPLITLGEYFKLTLQLILMMGAVFELPVVLMLLARFGIVDAKLLSKIRPQAYMALSVVAALITPTPDAFTMVLVLVPLCLLYEVSYWMVRWTVKQAAKPDEEETLH